MVSSKYVNHDGSNLNLGDVGVNWKLSHYVDRTNQISTDDGASFLSVDTTPLSTPLLTTNFDDYEEWYL